MAYKRELPTFNKDPEIKRTTVQNPDGTTTYKTDWSSKTPGRSSSYKAPTSAKPTSAKSSYVANRSTPAQTTSGSREITTVRPLKSVGILSQEITAPLPESIKKPVSRKEILENTNRYQESVWLKNNPGKTVEDRAEERAKYVKEAQNKPREKYITPDYVGKAKNKKATNPCKTC